MSLIKEQEAEVTEVIETIKALREVLATMVLMPEYTSDPNAIGTKTFKGNIQLPILQDKDREIAKTKLMELIASL